MSSQLLEKARGPALPWRVRKVAGFTSSHPILRSEQILAREGLRTALRVCPAFAFCDCVYVSVLSVCVAGLRWVSANTVGGLATSEAVREDKTRL